MAELPHPLGVIPGSSSSNDIEVAYVVDPTADQKRAAAKEGEIALGKPTLSSS